MKNDNAIPILIKYREGYYSKDDLKEEIYPSLIESKSGKRLFPTVWGKAIKRDLYSHNQMNVSDEITFGEDIACIVPSVYKCSSMYINNKHLYYYRFNPDAMTKKKVRRGWKGLLLISELLMREIGEKDQNFIPQIYRFTASEFFTVAASQFNGNDPYKEVKKDIIEHFNIDLFDKAIREASYEGKRAIIVKDSLYHRRVFVLYLFNKIGVHLLKTMKEIRINRECRKIKDD